MGLDGNSASISQVTIDEAARRLSVSRIEVLEYARHGKLEVLGAGDELRVIWPEREPSREVYPGDSRQIANTPSGGCHLGSAGDFAEGSSRPDTSDGRDPRWLVPLVLFLWIALFLAGVVWLFYLLHFSPQLPVARSLH